jgi:hypothetical protein
VSVFQVFETPLPTGEWFPAIALSAMKEEIRLLQDAPWRSIKFAVCCHVFTQKHSVLSPYSSRQRKIREIYGSSAAARCLGARLAEHSDMRMSQVILKQGKIFKVPDDQSNGSNLIKS